MAGTCPTGRDKNCSDLYTAAESCSQSTLPIRYSPHSPLFPSNNLGHLSRNPGASSVLHPMVRDCHHGFNGKSRERISMREATLRQPVHSFSDVHSRRKAGSAVKKVFSALLVSQDCLPLDSIG